MNFFNRNILIIGLFFVIIFIGVSTVSAASNGAPVCTNPSEQKDPDISGDLVVWEDHRNGNADIYMKNIKTGQEYAVCTESHIQTNPKISGNHVIWQDNRNPLVAIYAKDIVYTASGITLQNERKISKSVGGHSMDPEISGNRVVYDDNRNGDWDIYMYDFSSNAETRITYNAFNQEYASIDGNIIAWIDKRNQGSTTNVDIYMKDISTNLERRVTSNSGYYDHIKVSGQYIFYYNSGAIDRYNFNSGVTTRILKNAVQYDVYGNKIVWTDYRNGNDDIYIKDMSTGQEIAVCTDSHTQKTPAIFGNTVVWGDYRNGNQDIYSNTLDLTPVYYKSVTPKNKAKKILRSKTIVVFFNKNIKIASKSKIVLKNKKGKIIGAYKYVKGNKLYINPVKKLGKKTVYYIYIYSKALSSANFSFSQNNAKYKFYFVTGKK